jgi:cellulose biosynthesis protein BcsS
MAYRRADREPGAAVSPRLRQRFASRPAAVLVLAGWTVLAALAPSRASAGAKPVEGLAGWEGDGLHQGYGYGGFGILVPVASHVILPMRILGSYLYYNFTDSSEVTTVRSPGTTGLTGLRVMGARGNLTFLGGAEVRWERRKTDPGSTLRRRTIWGGMFQGEGDLALARRWRALALANYAGAAKYFFGRGTLRYQFTNLDWKGPTSLFAGFEGTRQGNDESAAWGGGGFLECAFVPARVSLSAHGGYKDTWSPGSAHRSSAYFGLGVYRRF